MNDHLRHVREQSDALAALVEQHPEAPVPPCPGWTVADVAGHVGRVHRLFTEAVRQGLTWRPEVSREAPGVAALPGWVRAGAGDLLRALASADPDGEVWNWTGTPAPPAWVARRMAHETVVHRWDAASAVPGAEPPPPPADLAADGIDEFLDVILEHRTEPWQGQGVTVALVRTDGPERWLLTVNPGETGARVERFPGGDPDQLDRAAAGVGATASDLVLLLWRRRSPDARASGDRQALARLLAWPRL